MSILIEDIDDDLRGRLERLRQERGVTFDRIANEIIRTGLDQLDAKKEISTQ